MESRSSIERFLTFGFRFFSVFRTSGLYTKTLAKIIYRDISRFLVVFVIIFLGFCGSMFMAITATSMQDTHRYKMGKMTVVDLIFQT